MRELRDPDIGVTGLGARSSGRLAIGITVIGFGAFLVIEVQRTVNVPAGLRWMGFAGSALFVLLGAMLLLEAAQGRRPLELRGNILTIPSGIRRPRIPLAEVTGSGCCSSEAQAGTAVRKRAHVPQHAFADLCHSAA